MGGQCLGSRGCITDCQMNCGCNNADCSAYECPSGYTNSGLVGVPFDIVECCDKDDREDDKNDNEDGADDKDDGDEDDGDGDKDDGDDEEAKCGSKKNEKKCGKDSQCEWKNDKCVEAQS